MKELIRSEIQRRIQNPDKHVNETVFRGGSRDFKKWGGGLYVGHHTEQNRKFSIRDFFSKCGPKHLWIWSHFLKKP